MAHILTHTPTHTRIDDAIIMQMHLYIWPCIVSITMHQHISQLGFKRDRGFKHLHVVVAFRCIPYFQRTDFGKSDTLEAYLTFQKWKG